MKKIFVDANIVIDYLNIDSPGHIIAKECIDIIVTYFGKPVVSPFTVLITNFIAGKFMKDKKKHRQKMQELFDGFQITPVQVNDVSIVFKSRFLDIEDGLQYQCALSGKASAIITQNLHDFFPATIPIVHPSEFVHRYKKLMN